AAHAVAIGREAIAEALHVLVRLEQVFNGRVGLRQGRISQPQVVAREELDGDTEQQQHTGEQPGTETHLHQSRTLGNRATAGSASSGPDSGATRRSCVFCLRASSRCKTPMAPSDRSHETELVAILPPNPMHRNCVVAASTSKRVTETD